MGPQPYPVIYVVANPVRGLLDRKISEELLGKASEARVNRRLRRYHLIVLLLPNICILACLLF